MFFECDDNTKNTGRYSSQISLILLYLQDQESMDTQDIHQETPDVVIEINVNSEEMAEAQEETTHVQDR